MVLTKNKIIRYECIEVSKFTNFPEILDGRIKTIHPKIHSGILYKRKSKTHKNLKKLNFESIDLVITNFYPFKKTLLETSTKKNHRKY